MELLQNNIIMSFLTIFMKLPVYLYLDKYSSQGALIVRVTVHSATFQLSFTDVHFVHGEYLSIIA